MGGMASSNDTFHPTRIESEFISAARFLMIVGLAYHHLYGIPGSVYYPRHSLEQYTHFAPDLVNGFFHLAFMAAVPVLSVISGFLFFRRPRIDFFSLLKKRLYSVALPSWLWSALWLFFAYLLYIAGSGYGRFEWANYGFENFSPLVLANGIVGVTRYPFAFQFWFVHDLLLTLVLSPLIYFLLRRLGRFFLAAMLLVWLTGFVPPLFFSFNVLFFFCIGTWLGCSGGPRLLTALEALNRFGWYLVPLFALALLTRLFSHRFGGLAPFFSGYEYLCLLRILGVLAFSQVLYWLVVRGGPGKEVLVRYGGYSFFIFAAHFPAIELFKAVAMRLPGAGTAPGFFLMWLLIPLATVAACIISAKVLERWCTPVFRLLNGGRAGLSPGKEGVRSTAFPPAAALPEGPRSRSRHRTQEPS